MEYRYPTYYGTDSVYDEKTNSWTYTYKYNFLNRIDAEQSRQAIKQYLNSLYGSMYNWQNVNENIKDIYLYGKTHLASDYGTMVKENKTMRLNDFVTFHTEGAPLLIKKDAVITISRLNDGKTRIETTNQIWFVDDDYADVIKRLFT